MNDGSTTVSTTFLVVGVFPISILADSSKTFEVRYSPTTFETHTSAISIANNSNGLTDPYTFTIQGIFNTPEIYVQGNSTSISDGNKSPDSGDDTDFGSVGVCSGTNPNTFTIQNTGIATMSVSNIQIIGTHALDFTLSGFTPTVIIGAVRNTTFIVTFNPTMHVVRDAIVTNTDCNEGSYYFENQGTGIDPVFEVAGSRVTPSTPSLIYWS